MIEAEAAAEVFFVSCNCDGTKLSFLTASSASDADSCFYIYDLIAEKLQQYSFRYVPSLITLRPEAAELSSEDDCGLLHACCFTNIKE